MSASATCPLCGYSSKNIVVPDPNWGEALNQVELEEATDRTQGVYGAILRLGRRTFWCPCGRMVWMGRTGWMVSFDFIARLATALRECTPDDYRRLIATLAVSIGQDFANVTKALEAKP